MSQMIQGSMFFTPNEQQTLDLRCNGRLFSSLQFSETFGIIEQKICKKLKDSVQWYDKLQVSTKIVELDEGHPVFLFSMFFVEDIDLVQLLRALTDSVKS
jgi:hypothetical protein